MTGTDHYHYRPARFFLVTLVATWVPWLIAIGIQSNPELTDLAATFNTLGLLAPFVVTLVFILGSRSRALKHDFKDRLVNLGRIRPLYLAAAILVPLVVMVVSILISIGLGQPRDQLRLSTSSNLVGMIVLALVLAPIIEELGWRGYGVDSLRAKLGTLPTSLGFGCSGLSGTRRCRSSAAPTITSSPRWRTPSSSSISSSASFPWPWSRTGSITGTTARSWRECCFIRW